MKRIAAAAALLFVAGCGTYDYGQGAYGEPAPYPYPAPSPYPGPEPYPSPYPPQPGGYSGQPNQPAPPECPITASREFTAWINAMPGPRARPMLIVNGKVVTASSGYQVAFDPVMQVRKGQPAQAFVTLHVASPTPGAATGVVVTHAVRWEWPLNQPVGSVVVRCGDKTLAEITNIQTAY